MFSVERRISLFWVGHGLIRTSTSLQSLLGGGVGKSTLINHWLRRMAAQHDRSAELVFGWSFYRQGTSGDTSSADEFLDAALSLGLVIQIQESELRGRRAKDWRSWWRIVEPCWF